ncbi:hypothetical protein Bca52824_031302 [Brassica carinata]|uniref:RNase H type-1 domain-containing protein n=1 Tax=Brassica carinata TaxID=52824 RepID=A0A8X7SAE0_BRACI|nr:hypothetical protein Bca52824_031302 [Brassica carinata]
MIVWNGASWKLSSKESEAWRIAQIVGEFAETTPSEEVARQVPVNQAPAYKWRCHVDASWKDRDEVIVLGFILFEDRQQLVRFINKPQEWPALGPELDKFLCSEFSSISFNFIRRSDNVRADCLSKAGRSRDKGYCFVGDIAPFWLAHEADLFEPLAN